jgi:hypothetical protein
MWIAPHVVLTFNVEMEIVIEYIDVITTVVIVIRINISIVVLLIHPQPNLNPPISLSLSVSVSMCGYVCGVWMRVGVWGCVFLAPP